MSTKTSNSNQNLIKILKLPEISKKIQIEISQQSSQEIKSLDKSSAFIRYFKKNKKFSVPFNNQQAQMIFQENESSQSPKGLIDAKPKP